MSLYLGALLIFCLRIGDVSAATLRVIFLVNGKRFPATCLAFCESAIWVIAISQVFQYLDRWQNMVGYACGYAAGTLCGITLDQFIGIGTAVVRVFTKDPSTELRDKLAADGYGVTLFLGEGVNGPVQELIIVISRRRRKHLLKRVCEIDPDAFITVETVSASYGGYSGKPVRDHNK
jgi:uncharacterized protein YebE (UPF0316 family)